VQPGRRSDRRQTGTINESADTTFWFLRQKEHIASFLWRAQRPSAGHGASQSILNRLDMNSLFLFLLLTQPMATEEIKLPGNFSRLQCSASRMYLAPRIGGSIFEFVNQDSLRPISFTDEVNYRIYDFIITPFAIYTNRGAALEKFFIASGRKETIYRSRDISSFTLTPTDEIVLADREKHELVFLDFFYRVKFKIENVYIEDIRWQDTMLYALSSASIHIYDEYGNMVEKITVPQRSNRIIPSGDEILLFNEGENHVYRGIDWVKLEFPFSISDICMKENTILLLDGAGHTIHSYSRDGF
jgi:hypothetical protein